MILKGIENCGVFKGDCRHRGYQGSLSMALCLDPISRLWSMSRYLKAGTQSQPPACVVAHLHGVFLFEVAGDKTEVSVAAWISRTGGEKCPRPH